ncbi:MAG: DDE-type integrase/transposase/recombinase [Nitrospirae bacterium]|nr:DDE-type integrase/transposase/recombinase [Nitrospirota bacterium]
MFWKFCLTTELKKQLLKISARQSDRRLKTYKYKAKKCLYGGTKPGSLLKHHIPIKTDHWDVKEPGFTEVDTVSHSGNNADGLFAYSVNQTDILTGWVETRAVLGKGEKEVVAALEEVEEDFPFPILGIDADNGSEFINHHLYRRCQQKKIQFTRGRPYKKDDNAHIEQKNWTHVRKLMGWNRYDTLAAVNAMNDLYKNELRLFMNLFLPSMKLLEKERVGSKKKRKYDDPKTPLDRVIESGKGDLLKIEQIKNLRKQLDPFMLSQIIEKKLEVIARKANHRQSPKSASAETEKQTAKLSQKETSVMHEVAHMLGMHVQYV